MFSSFFSSDLSWRVDALPKYPLSFISNELSVYAVGKESCSLESCSLSLAIIESIVWFLGVSALTFLKSIRITFELEVLAYSSLSVLISVGSK